MYLTNALHFYPVAVTILYHMAGKSASENRNSAEIKWGGDRKVLFIVE